MVIFEKKKLSAYKSVIYPICCAFLMQSRKVLYKIQYSVLMLFGKRRWLFKMKQTGKAIFRRCCSSKADLHAV